MFVPFSFKKKAGAEQRTLSKLKAYDERLDTLRTMCLWEGKHILTKIGHITHQDVALTLLPAEVPALF